MGKTQTDDMDQMRRVTLCPDGVYRWVYAVDMYRNPAIFLTLLRCLGMAAAIIGIFGVFMMVVSGDWRYMSLSIDWDENKYGILALFVFLLVVMVSYLIVAKSYGGKYIVLFEMDETKVVHTQMKSQFDKAAAFGWFTTVVGALSGNLSMAGLGLVNATRDSMISMYSEVRKVIPSRRMHLIRVNNLLQHNQVYVCDEDFDLALQYLQEHVAAAKGGLGNGGSES